MVILNLPDEPNSPAGKAIKNASEPLTGKSPPAPNKFQLAFKSDPYLGDGVYNLTLDLSIKELTFNCTENARYDWINWLLEVPEDESITLFFLDKNNKQKCILVLDDLYVYEHTCEMNNSFRDDEMEHKVVVQFANVERLSID